MKRLRSIIRVIPLLILMAAGCSSEECMQNKNALPLAGFYDTSDPSRSISVDSLEVYGVDVPGDSILSPGLAAVNELYLPFRLDSDTTSYVFRYLHKTLAALNLRDTVTFIYTREPRFVSSACGVSYVFTVRDITSTGLIIDSVSCPAGEVTNMATENLHIYFRTKEQ